MKKYLSQTVLTTFFFVSFCVSSGFTQKGIWISPEEIAGLPMQGPAWEALKKTADEPAGVPDISDKNNDTNVRVLAKALVYVRTGEEKYRSEVIRTCMAAIGTETGGPTLSLGRNLLGYILAADLVCLPEADNELFKKYLQKVRSLTLSGRTLISTHEERPNNWGLHCGASRIAIALYLEDRPELERCAKIFKGWLGDRSSYAGFRFRKDFSWHADPDKPVGINPKGAKIAGYDVDGVLPDEQRRAGSFTWPPPPENYVWGGLQAAVAQAEMLHRAGFDAYQWEDQALLRALKWLYGPGKNPAKGDDRWIVHVINFRYHSDFPTETPAYSGKNIGWTDWTHGERMSPGE